MYNAHMSRGRRAKTTTRNVQAVIGYVRVSTEDQAESGAGMESQRSSILAECERNGWQLVELIEEPGVSAKNMNRPGLQRALELLAAGQADILMAAKLDRLSRSVKDVCNLGDRALCEGWNLCLLDARIDTTTPHGRAQLSMMATFAQLERELIGLRTKEALAVKKAQGIRLGAAPTIDADAEDMILKLRAEGKGMAAIAKELNDRQVPTAKGGTWHGSTVRVVLTRRAA